MSTAATSDAALAGLRAAADTGAPEALHRLATALAARQDLAGAFALHKQAAIEGYLPARIDVARMLLHGSGCMRDPRTAVYWLRHAEDAGNAEASYYLALIALGSVAMPRDGRINERVLATVQGDYPPALRAAAIHFGRKRHQADQASCVRLLDRAASHGDTVAAQLLAERLARGEGCAVQAAAAERIHRRLASLGIAALPAIAIPQAVDGTTTTPPGTIALEEMLHPVATRTLAAQPQAMQIDDLLSADECRLLIACAQQIAGAAQATVRIDPAHEDMALRLVQLRLARSARMQLAQAEPLLITHCGAASHAHSDGRSLSALPAGALARAGERVRTIHAFLNAGDAGAGIALTTTETTIQATAGRAVIVDGDETDQWRCGPSPAHDTSDRHPGFWLATLHFHRRRYRDF